LFTEKAAPIVVNSPIWFHLVPSDVSSAWPDRPYSPLSAEPTIFVVVNAHHVLGMISDELSPQLRKPPQVEVGKPPRGTTRTTSGA
jgi:hypothetical protein